MSRPIVVVVLGMHRSFTSAIARLLNLAGAGIAPDLVKSNSANPAGYWESCQLNHINEGILRKLGRSWHDWRPLPPDVSAVTAEAAIMAAIRDDLQAAINRAPVAVVKEPRLCQLFPIWQTAVAPVDADIRVIIPIRSPLDVAASLERRDGLARTRSLLLWLRYALAAEAASRTLPRAIIDAGRLMEDWRTGLPELIAALQLPLDGTEPDGAGQFIDKGLIHHRTEIADRMPPWVAECHGIMLGLADKDDTRSRRRLTEIRAQFDSFCRQFGDYVASLEEDPAGIAVNRAAERLFQAISEERNQDLALDSFLEAAKQRPPEALLALAPAISWHSQSPWTLRAVGRTALIGGNLVRACEALQRLDAGGTATPRDLRYLGWTLAGMKRWAEASSAADRAVAEDPDEPGGLFLQATIHERAGDIHAARAIAELLAERHPDYSPGRTLLDRLPV